MRRAMKKKKKLNACAGPKGHGGFRSAWCCSLQRSSCRCLETKEGKEMARDQKTTCTKMCKTVLRQLTDRNHIQEKKMVESRHGEGRSRNGIKCVLHVPSWRMIAGPTRDTNRNRMLDHSTGPSMVTPGSAKEQAKGPGEGLVPFWRDRGGCMYTHTHPHPGLVVRMFCCDQDDDNTGNRTLSDCANRDVETRDAGPQTGGLKKRAKRAK